MNRNSLIGIILIMVVLIGWSIWRIPSKEKIAKQLHIQDSITRLNKEHYIQDSIKYAEAKAYSEQSEINRDISESNRNDKFGVFANASIGKKQTWTLENDVLKITLSSKGAYVKKVELKNYVTWDSLPLIGFDEKTSKFNLTFVAMNKGINSIDLYFEPYLNGIPYKGDSLIFMGENDSLVMSLRAYVNDRNGNENLNKYLEFIYTMYPGQYMVDFNINTVGLKDIIASNTRFMTIDWNVDILKQEKAVDRYNGSTIYYKFLKDKVESLSERGNKDEAKDLRSSLRWISFKQRFFSYSIISKESFDDARIEMKTNKKYMNPRYLKSMAANIDIPYNGLNEKNNIGMSFYFGPNNLKILESYNLKLEKQIPLGGKVVAWINRYIVINVFNWLGRYGWNYGIVILVLTIIIKVCLMPFAYKSYMSSAKMRVLKPELDAINKKYPKQEDNIRKQQVIMDLYKRAGIKPTSGCLPMLLQLPILWAIFRFFPSSIELRQQSFLWATDLSTYDSIFDLPFKIPFYGDHVSLFTLLMTISTIVYTYTNNKMMSSAQGSQGMPGMKFMMYLMPIMFLGIFNNYSAGLSYYYLLVNLFTFAQMYIFKFFINEDKLRKSIEMAKKKPVKKSKFQKRLEEIQRQQQQQIRKR